MSEHALSCYDTQGEYRASEMEMRREGEVLIEVTNWLPTRLNLYGKVHME